MLNLREMYTPILLTLRCKLHNTDICFELHRIARTHQVPWCSDGSLLSKWTGTSVPLWLLCNLANTWKDNQDIISDYYSVLS